MTSQESPDDLRAASSVSRVWLITGAGRGFGRLFVETALGEGERVVATARKPEVLDDLVAQSDGRLVVLPLDVSDRAAVFSTIDQAVATFGRLDIVINNADHGLSGAVEEVTEEAARAIFDTNLFGAMWVCQAVIPHLRAQGGGTIVQLSSVSGLVGIPTMSLYTASKFALEGLSESMAHEVSGFGISVTLVEPRVYQTDFMGSSMRIAEFNDAYLPVRQMLMQQYSGARMGDPRKVAEGVLTLVNSEEKPLRLLLGDGEFDTMQAVYQGRMQEWKSWEAVSRAAG
jgi:NAD(P)-dependent dehydrogenase (short-subunit alcohol dehydrogenase family)